MTKSLPWIALAALALLPGCVTTDGWQYGQPAYAPPYCDPSQEPCPPSEECEPGQYCAPGAYGPGMYGPGMYGPGMYGPGYAPDAYAPAPYPAPGYVPPEAYGPGDLGEDGRWEHGHEGGRPFHAVPAPPRVPREGARHEGED